MEEKWLSINGYEGLYEVSNLGNVRRIGTVVESKDGVKRFFPGKMKKPVCVHGYMYVTLYRGNEYERPAVHRLVATAFCENPEGKPMVNHINGDKGDNRAANLEWVTASENSAHAYKTGLARSYDKSGEKNPMYGKHHSESAKAKIASVHSGTKHTEETRAKMSAAKKGKPFTEEHKKALSLSNKRAMLGKRHMVKDGVKKIVSPEEIQQHLDDGWAFTKRSKK